METIYIGYLEMHILSATSTYRYTRTPARKTAACTHAQVHAHIHEKQARTCAVCRHARARARKLTCGMYIAQFVELLFSATAFPTKRILGLKWLNE